MDAVKAYGQIEEALEVLYDDGHDEFDVEEEISAIIETVWNPNPLWSGPKRPKP